MHIHTKLQSNQVVTVKCRYLSPEQSVGWTDERLTLPVSGPSLEHGLPARQKDKCLLQISLFKANSALIKLEESVEINVSEIFNVVYCTYGAHLTPV